MSDGEISPTKRYYGSSLQVEIFNSEEEGVYIKSVDVENRWENLTKETCKSGRIVNGICTKLLRGDCNYSLLLEDTLKKIIILLSSEIGSVVVVSDSQKENSKENSLICLALGEKEAGLISPFQNKHKNSQPHKSMDGIFGYALNANKVVISNDIPKDPRATKTKPKNHPHIINLLAIPLKYQDSIIGVLSVANKNGDFSIDSIKTVLPLLEICSNLLMKSLDSRETLASVYHKEKQVEKAKDRFLATMSHELRTPLNGIMGMVTLFPDAGPMNHKQKEYIKNLTECTVRLTSLLNNILDFSKMASDRLKLQKQPFTIQEVVDDSVKMIEGNAFAKGLDLKIDIPKNIPIMLGDKQRIIQILSNLLFNSYKFTDRGFIKLTAETSLVKSKLEDFSSHKWKVIFYVEDTGIGIPYEEQDKIFEVFNQSSSLSTYLSQSGTGLGLSIARELVRLMNGKISVQSEGIPGKGCIFKFYIMLEEEINIQLLEKDHIRLLTNSHILVVDDKPEIRLQLSDILFKWKCIPQAVSSAEEALQYLQYGMKFKAILVDIHMPGMSGVELAQELRRKYPEIPLIGLSSIELKSGEDYFDFYMYKPINQSSLFSALIKCISDPKESSKRKSTRKKKSKRKLKILVAEDDSHNRFTIRELLISLGYKKKNIKMVNDGSECVEEVESGENYDVILMDIVMPKMNGTQASKIIKSMDNPPMIIAVSAAVQPSDKDKCLNARIDGYLSKPVDKDKLRISLLPLIKKTKNENKDKNKNDTIKYGQFREG